MKCRKCGHRLSLVRYPLKYRGKKADTRTAPYCLNPKCNKFNKGV